MLPIWLALLISIVGLVGENDVALGQTSSQHGRSHGVVVDPADLT